MRHFIVSAPGRVQHYEHRQAHQALKAFIVESQTLRRRAKGSSQHTPHYKLIGHVNISKQLKRRTASLLRMDFKLNRTLLNPKFEGYKLDPIPQENAVKRYKLSRRPTQATASTRSPLAFEEMRSRITHNHLAVESVSALAAYVDDQYTVCLISVISSTGSGVGIDSSSCRIMNVEHSFRSRLKKT